jgi:signal transduction histidine kinase
MKNINLKILITLISIILYVITYQINSVYKDKFIQDELNYSLKELKTNYDIVLYNYAKAAQSLYQQISKNPRIVEILTQSLDANHKEKAILRKELYSIIEEQFKASKKLGLKLILFSHPDNNVFLRAHKPDKYGDNLGQIRYAVKKVNSEHKKFIGFEPGKITHAFRNIYPIFNKDRYIGCVDIGFSSEYLQFTLDEVHKIHTHFLVAKDIIDKRLWKVKEITINYKNSLEDDHYLVSVRKDVAHNFKVISKQTIHANSDTIHKNMDQSKEFSLYGYKNDTAIIISFMPIFSIDQAKRPSAYIVAYVKSDQIIRILNNFLYINFASLIVIALIMLQIYQTLSHKDELKKEVAKKTNELFKLNQSLEARIVEEVEKNRKNELQMYEQSKNASLGEMIGNIAHQWRQPLSAITSTASSVKLNNQLGILDKDEIENNMDVIIHKANYLSETINTFRNFLNKNKSIETFLLEDMIEESINIINVTLKEYHIDLKVTIDKTSKSTVTGIKNEVSQVLINILNNAKDTLLEKNIDNKYINLSLKNEDDKALITIEDNGKGIPIHIMPKIFEPYFTTKHQSQGTGLGLHMCYKIVTESLQGKIWAQNTNKGAKFFIEIPLVKNNT